APESMYNDQLDMVVKVLADKKLIVNSEGAKCAFFADGELSGGETTPYIVQKKDGGYLYSTTDLAAVDYRTHILHGTRLLYVVDARQSFHFKQLFSLAKKAGFAEQNTTMEHIYFGTMMNEQGKPFKTREGGTVKLINLINEAKQRAEKLIEQKNTNSNQIDLEELAKKLAIASIKYADLSKNRTSDYIFAFDKMLAFEGNTAPYLLYAYTRIQGLLKKASQELDYPAELVLYSSHKIIISHATEHKLAVLLARFADILLITAKECYPHYLCQYLYGLSGAFMQFYEVCNIVKEPNQELVISRLVLVDKIAQILKTGLGLLGISTVEKM
ncbi:MAG: arginine--tRNA ligase, partial [Burkholderiales bacterium]|nr:arginine--tRNA ligase [Burkholderiales bacterium]